MSSNSQPLTEQEFLELTQITDTPILSEAEFRDRIRLEVPTETPVRETERLTNEQLAELARNPLWRPEAIRKRHQQRLDELSDKDTSEETNSHESEKILNLSLRTVFENISDTFTGVLTDIFDKPEELSILDHLIKTFTKDDRLVYIGVMIVIVSIFLSLIQTD